MKNNGISSASPMVLPAAERREDERSETDRSTAAGKTVAAPGAVPRPDPQVVAKAKRRIFTAEYKQRILAEADKAKERSGALGTLLRRESLYSSHLVTWRQERAAGVDEVQAGEVVLERDVLRAQVLFDDFDWEDDRRVGHFALDFLLMKFSTNIRN